jgi:hypothetical protein
MDQRRAYLKELAARSARRWSAEPLAPCFAGETRIETRNTVYHLREGVCFLVTHREEVAQRKMAPSAFHGMRVVGWLMRDDPQAGITPEWRPGAYAVLWRPRDSGEEHSAVALTSSSIAFRVVARTTPPPLPAVQPPVPTAAQQTPTVRTGRISTPPPLPLAIPRGSSFGRSLTPPAFVPPPPSMTRVHMKDVAEVPVAPETPTPQLQRRSAPPPLPPQSRGIRPLPPRLPALG